jgi:hypothetical protein
VCIEYRQDVSWLLVYPGNVRRRTRDDRLLADATLGGAGLV